MNQLQVDAYLARVCAARPASSDAESLRELQARHLQRVPFENLSIHLHEPIELDDDALFEKIVQRRRGGFCYELNGAFASLLSELGYDVTLLAARVQGRTGLGPPFDHLALRVDTPEPWLVDVGFGAFSTYPLRLDVRADQTDPSGTFRIAEHESGDFDVFCNDELQYRLEKRPRDLSDFEPTCWWHQTSPKSHFTWSPVCSLPTESGRITLSDRILIRTEGSQRQQRTLTDNADLLDAYATYFGIVLDRVPEALHPRRT